MKSVRKMIKWLARDAYSDAVSQFRYALAMKFAQQEVRAQVIALKALDGKTDLAGGPIYRHCYRVAMGFSWDDDACIVALLHDVVEDSDVTLEELSKTFPEKIVAAVDAITRREDETYEAYINRVSENKIARKVKIADLKDNMDISRLASLADKDIVRLQKYHQAYNMLVNY